MLKFIFGTRVEKIHFWRAIILARIILAPQTTRTHCQIPKDRIFGSWAWQRKRPLAPTQQVQAATTPVTPGLVPGIRPTRGRRRPRSQNPLTVNGGGAEAPPRATHRGGGPRSARRQHHKPKTVHGARVCPHNQTNQESSAPGLPSGVSYRPKATAGGPAPASPSRWGGGFSRVSFLVGSAAARVEGWWAHWPAFARRSDPLRGPCFLTLEGRGPATRRERTNPCGTPTLPFFFLLYVS